ncbi:MAG: N-acetyl sugar amidotransferase [Bacteroidia bacterium]
MSITPDSADYQQCVNCVMDTTDPDIFFDEKGVCSHCLTYPVRKKAFVPEEMQGKILLDNMVKACRNAGRNKNYDCVIGVSGGVDSSYVAYLVHQLGLRPLAVHLDNGWNSELAVSNIRNLLDKLNIELHTYVLDWESFLDLQLAFLRSSTPDSEIPSDHAIVALMREIANKEGVPVIWGVNFSSEAILPQAWSQGHMDWTYIRNVHNKFGTKKLVNYPHYSVWKLIWYNRFKRQKLYNILNYIPYNKEEAKRILIQETGWRDYGGKHYESTYTRIFQSYILPVKFNFDKRKAHYSSLILAGQITRSEAAEMLKKSPYDEAGIKSEIVYLSKKLQISVSEFEQIMQTKPKKYSDYKSNWPELVKKTDKALFNRIIAFKRFLFKSL